MSWMLRGVVVSRGLVRSRTRSKKNGLNQKRVFFFLRVAPESHFPPNSHSSLPVTPLPTKPKPGGIASRKPTDRIAPSIHLCHSRDTLNIRGTMT